MKIILASQSPRRRELLERMGITDFKVIPAKGEEIATRTLTTDQLVEELSRRKCAEVAALRPKDLVIAADTMVFLKNRRLGKPADEAEAFAMLSALSGRTHTVCTGLTVRQGDQVLSGAERTTVRFRPLTEGEIRSYIATGEPMDKAGAYGIQDRGALLVEGIEGDFFNVMGLPVLRLSRMLRTFGVDLLCGGEAV